MRARLAPSRRAALVFVGALSALLVLVLASQSARVPLRTPLVPRSARGEPVAIPLEAREGRGGSGVFRLEVRLEDPRLLASHDELWLFLSSPTPGRTLVGAELRARGSSCSLLAYGGDEVGEDRPVVLSRSAECTDATALAAGTALDLRVELQGEGKLFLLGFRSQPGAEHSALRATPPGARPGWLDVRGHFVRYPATLPRIVLLGHMWRIAPGWLGLLVVSGVGLALAGCLVFPTRRRAERFPASATSVLRAAAGASLLAGSLAVLHAGLEPPLSGPDEPYHLLGYADLVHDAALAKDTVIWMGETHLWRTRQQPAERFRSIDVGAPYVVEDSQLRPTEVAMRSAVLARLWRAVAPALAGARASRALLTLRLLNGLVFALAVGAAVGFAVATLAEPYSQWAGFAFLFVPSLPFFATHVSETALLCSIYVLLAAGVVVTSLDGPRAHWAGVPLGLAVGLMLAGGRSPWPLVALVAAVLLGRALLGSRGAASPARAALVFWGGFAPGALAFFALQDEAYRTMSDLWALHFTGFIPGPMRAAGEWLRTRPAWVAALVGMGAALELALARPRAWVSARLVAASPTLVRRASLAIAAWPPLTLVGSLLVAYPQLPMPQPLGAAERVAAVLASMATVFRLVGHDFLLASSFWVGFGWLDTMPGPAFQAWLVVLVACALVCLLLQIARVRDARRLGWLLLIGAGSVASLVLYVLATQRVPLALGGRYLVGWYLALLAVVGGVLTLDPWWPSRRVADARWPDGALRAALLVVVAASVHVYVLCFVLRRYF